LTGSRDAAILWKQCKQREVIEMYGFVYATLVADTREELEKQVDQYRKYPHFEEGFIRPTTGKFKRQGKYMVIVNYFNND